MRALRLGLVILAMVPAGCQRWKPCSVIVESVLDRPLDEVRVVLDQTVVLHSAYVSRIASSNMHIGIKAPAQVATVQWLGDDGKRQRQVLQLTPEEGCTKGMLVLRFVEGTDGVEVQMSVRPL